MRPTLTLRRLISTRTSSSILNEVKNSALDQFNSIVIRKPKVAIAGTDVAGLAAALKLHQYGITPTILRTRSQEEVTNEKVIMISNYAASILWGLGLEEKVRGVGCNMDVFQRVDAENGKVFGFLNYSSIFKISKYSTCSMGYWEFWRLMWDEVTSKMEVIGDCVINSIRTKEADVGGNYVEFDPKYLEHGCDQSVEFVKSRTVEINYSVGQNSREVVIDTFDVLLIAEGLHSSTRELLFPGSMVDQGEMELEETVVSRPQSISDNAVVDIWGWTYRCGYIPLTRDQMYVYCLRNLPTDEKARRGDFVMDVSSEGMTGVFTALDEPHSHLSSLIYAKRQVKKSVSICSIMNLLHMSPEEPILALGSTQLALPLPNFGKDIALDLESGTFAAFMTIDNRAPLLHLFTMYRVLSKQYEYLFWHLHKEMEDSLSRGISLPLWLHRLMAKFGQHGNNNYLTDHETSFRGMAREAIDRQRLAIFNDKNYLDLRLEWLSMSESQRKLSSKLYHRKYNQHSQTFVEFLKTHNFNLKKAHIEPRDLQKLHKRD